MGLSHVRASGLSGGDAVVASEVVKRLELPRAPQHSFSESSNVGVGDEILPALIFEQFGNHLDPLRSRNHLAFDELLRGPENPGVLGGCPEGAMVRVVVRVDGVRDLFGVRGNDSELFLTLTNHAVERVQVDFFLHAASDLPLPPRGKQKHLGQTMVLTKKHQTAISTDFYLTHGISL